MWRATEIAWNDFVNVPPEDMILVGMVIFCRSGGCMMVLPGFSNEHIPIRIRLYIAIALAVPLIVSLADKIEKHISGAPIYKIAGMVICELIIGVLLGTLSRLLVLALETAATSVTMSIGIGNLMSAPISDSETLPSMASLIVLGATTLIFVSDQHWELIRGLYQSYDYVPPVSEFNGEFMMRELLQALRQSYLLVFRICSPFLMFALIVNLGFGFLNRMTPHVPVYFLSAPLIILLGLQLFYSIGADFFGSLSAEIGRWIIKGN